MALLGNATLLNQMQVDIRPRRARNRRAAATLENADPKEPIEILLEATAHENVAELAEGMDRRSIA